MSIAIGENNPRSKASSLRWFAAHEARLIWRDFAFIISGGKTRRVAAIGAIIGLFIIAMHGLAAYLIAPVLAGGIVVDKATLLMVSGGLAMFFSLMFSQAIESVTRAYYARSDLDLILSSPARSEHLFQVRTSVLTLQTIALSVLIASPMINVLIYMDGWRWAGAYVVLASLGGVATAIAVIMTLLLFRIVGTARTRFIAQIIAAVVGAGFVISLQAFAILFGQGMSRFALFSSDGSIASAPDTTSLAWIPAQAAMGDGLSILMLFIICALFLYFVVLSSAKRFAKDVLATAGMVERKTKSAVFHGFIKGGSLRSTLRRKEWKLLRRDPWLISQSLQQILYLVPPALMLWVNYGEGDGIYYVVVPVIVMAAGQLAGGLSWITISGEDAHELIETAPVGLRTILTAKVEAVIAVIALVVAPFALALLLFSPRAAFWMLIGTALASASAVLIQLWFRSQANRSMFRRRQVSSKAATISEALVSILWAAAAGLGIMHGALFFIPAMFVIIILAIAYFIRPRREG
ncbi:MAG: permease [Rhizobiaceae bacterium]